MCLNQRSRQFRESSSVSLLQILVSITLFPHLNLADFHLSLLLPSRIPNVLLLPEILWSRWGRIQPRLSTLSVLEPTIGTTDCNIHDQVEFLVEWSLLATGLRPDVLKSGAVGVGEWELTAFPEWFIKVGVQDLEETGVDVSEEILLGPFKTELVLGLGVSGVKSSSLDVGSPPGIVGKIWSPMKSRGNDVVTTLLVCVVVTARFHDINLSRQWPWSVSVLDRQHPDGRPQPITGWHLCSYLDTTILYLCSLLGVDTAGFDGWDDLARGQVGLSDAVLDSHRGTKSIGGQVDDVVRVDEGSLLESWLDDQLAILDEDVLVGRGGLLELSVTVEKAMISTRSSNDYKRNQSHSPETTNFSFLGPNIGVETF